MRKSQARPQIGDLFAKAGTPGLHWVVHRLLPDIDPGVPHVELLRVGDASTRVTISLPALTDPRMFERVESNPSIERQLAEMGFGHALADDAPPAAARDAEAAGARADAAATAADEAPAETHEEEEAEPAAEDEDDRVTQLYPADRSDDSLDGLERIEGLPGDAPGEDGADADEEPPQGAAPESRETPAEPALRAAPETPPDDADAPVEEVVDAPAAVPARDPGTPDMFAGADDFDRVIAAADPDRAGPPVEEAEETDGSPDGAPDEDRHER